MADLAKLPPGPWDRLNLDWSSTSYSLCEISQAFGPNNLPSHLLVEEGYYSSVEDEEFNRGNLFLVHAVTKRSGGDREVLLCSLVDLQQDEQIYEDIDDLNEDPENYDLIFMLPLHLQTGASFRIAWRKSLFSKSVKKAMDPGQPQSFVPIVDSSKLKGTRWDGGVANDVQAVNRDDEDYELIVDILKEQVKPPLPEPPLPGPPLPVRATTNPPLHGSEMQHHDRRVATPPIDYDNDTERSPPKPKPRKSKKKKVPTATLR